MLREGLKMSPDEGQEELEEVQAEIKKKDEEVSFITGRGIALILLRLWLTGVFAFSFSVINWSTGLLT